MRISLGKKIGAITVLATQAATLGVAFAASPASYFPENTALYYQLDTTVTNPLMGLIQEMHPTDQTGSFIDLLKKSIQSNQIGFGMKMNTLNGQPSMYLSMAMIEADLNNILSAAEKESMGIQKTDLGSQKYVYSAPNNFFFTYTNGMVVASDNKLFIDDTARGAKLNSLFNAANFQTFQTQGLTNSFFGEYINFTEKSSAINSQMNLENIAVIPTFFKNFLDGISSENIWIKQNPDGFSGKVIVKTNPTFNQLFPAGTAASNFVPTLYKKINANGLLMVQEMTKLDESVKLMSQLIATTEEMKADMAQAKAAFKASTTLDFDQDFAPLFNGEVAFTIHQDAQVLPALTIMSDVSGKQAKAQTAGKSIIKALTTWVQNEQAANPNDEMWSKAKITTNQQVQVNSVNFDSLTIDFSETLDASASTELKQNAKFTISAGVTNDNTFVMTTLRNPNDLYSITGLTAQTYLTNRVSSGMMLTSFSYMNIDNLQKYVSNTAKLVDPTMSETDMNSIRDAFAPWHQFVSVSTATNDTLTGIMDLQVEVAKLGGTFDFLKEAFNRGFNMPDLMEEMPSMPSEPIQTGNYFIDVNSTDWFHTYAQDLAQKAIVRGYTTTNGNEFRGNQPITRAEFVQILMAAQDFKGVMYAQVEPSTYFTDVNLDSQQWYTPAVNRAKAYNLVTGFTDNTFRPNQPITRAEVVQILTNTQPSLKEGMTEGSATTSGHPFTDVQTGDWFKNAVVAAYQAQLVSGVDATHFEPNRPITRAEAGKIISKYLGM